MANWYAESALGERGDSGEAKGVLCCGCEWRQCWGVTMGDWGVMCCVGTAEG